ncbi:MAG: type II secretion system protein GspN [Desulfuromusa sp.]|nr:type II secretion system protein GspN [Desulfuromusa sp.]
MSRVSFSFFSWQRLAGQRRLFLLCLLLFVVSAFLSFGAFFPADVVQQRLVHEVSQQTNLEMKGRNAKMLFPLGVEFDLTVYSAVPNLTDLELTQLQVSPAWSSLFSKDQAVNLSGAFAGGKIDVDVSRSGRIDLNVEDVALAVLQQSEMPYRVIGQLTGQLDGENISGNMNGRGFFSFQLKDARILGLEKIGLPDNFFAGALWLEGKFDQQRFNLEKVVLTGGVLELSGGGNILIGETSKKTRLNLNIRLHPTTTTPDSIRDLISLAGIRPTTDGSYLLRVGGTLAKPIIR